MNLQEFLKSIQPDFSNLKISPSDISKLDHFSSNHNNGDVVDILKESIRQIQKMIEEIEKGRVGDEK